ncbi:MAG: hypothetical protein ABI778_02220, partial [Ignavibacteriota bacterium]
MNDPIPDPTPDQKPLHGAQTSILSKSVFLARRFYSDLVPTLRWTLFVLAGLCIISALLLLGSKAIFSSPSEKQGAEASLLTEVTNRLEVISERTAQIRDTVALDSIFSLFLKDDVLQNILFERLHVLDSARGHALDEVRPQSLNEPGSVPSVRGLAFYDKQMRLTAWSSIGGSTVNFDSVFSFASLLEKHSKTMFSVAEQNKSWVVAIRKLISKEGALLGFVEARTLVSERILNSSQSDRSLTIFADIFARSGRGVAFTLSPDEIDSTPSIKMYPLFVDRSDSSTLAGYLTIGETTSIDETGFLKIIHYIGDISFIFLILIVGWLLVWRLAEHGCSSRASKIKVQALAKITLLLLSVRILDLVSGSLAVILPKSLQDPLDFSLPIGFGMFSNPLQLFISIFFLTLFLSLAWVVIVPKKSRWKSDELEIEAEYNPTTAGWLAKVFSILGLLLVVPVINVGFVTLINTIIDSGAYHYLYNKFGFSKGSFVIMEATLLLTGVSYLFAIGISMLWIIRAMIRLTAAELSPTRSYAAHYIFFTILTTITAWRLSPDVLHIYPELYWLLLTPGLCILCVVLFSRDIKAIKDGQRGDSLFYRIPRSGLALLFLLTGAGFIISPLVGIQEYSNDIDIVKQELRQNSQISTLDNSLLLDQVFQSLDESSSRITSLTRTNDLTNLAFNVWLKLIPESSKPTSIIEIQDVSGKVLSHFTQNSFPFEGTRLSAIHDSILGLLKTQTRGSVSLTHLNGSVPSFTESGTVASVGVGWTKIDNTNNFQHRAGDNIEYRDVLVSITIWKEQIPVAESHSLYDLFRTSSDSHNRLVRINQDFGYSDYRNGVLVNSTRSSNVAHSQLPIGIAERLQKSEFVLAKEVNEGTTTLSVYHSVDSSSGGVDNVLAATIAIPGLFDLLKLSLNFNAVSLFIGFFVIFFALLIRSVFAQGKRGALKFRDRIFLIVLTIALVPLAIVTNITCTLLIEREQRIEREHLQRDAKIIAEKVGSLRSQADTSSTPFIKSVLFDLSRTIGRDISLFNERGILRTANRPELYQSALLANELSSRTYRQIFSGQKSFTVEPLESGATSFDVGYQTIADHGQILGVIGVTSFQGSQSVEADIARTIELMYAAFAALGIILLLIGAWISVRVATPIQQLIAATERVTGGELETIVDIHR